MKETNQIKDGINPIRLPDSKKADRNELESFWKSLRHFYRTGEKTYNVQIEGCFPVLKSIMSKDPSKYPFKFDTHQEDWLRFENKALFELLNIQLKEHLLYRREEFREKLIQLLGGLEKILKIDPEFKVEEMQKTYEFANTLMAFDKMAKIVSRKSGKGVDITEERTERLKTVLNTLQTGIKNFNNKLGTIIISKDLSNRFSFFKIFKDSDVIINDIHDPFTKAMKLFKEEIKEYVELIRAYRIAILEADNKYQSEIHDEYFTHFTRHRFSLDETQIIQPIIVIVSHDELNENIASLLKLMTSNLPIKVIVINDQLVTGVRDEISWEDAAHQYRQEIAAIAISQRNVYAFQSTIAEPEFIKMGFDHLLKTSIPGLSQILINSDGNKNQETELLLRASSLSRFFPNLIYDPSLNTNFRSIDLSANVQEDNSWPEFSINLLNEKKEEIELSFYFNYADYKALFPEKLKELLLIPIEYYTDGLIPLSKYLELEEKELYGKIPYINLVDENGYLQRAAVPNLWVVSCQERLDYWNFLRQFSNQSETVQREDIDTRVEKDGEKIALSKEEYEEKLKIIQENAIQIAAERMIKGLLGNDDILNEFMNRDVKNTEEPDLSKNEEIAYEEKTENKSEETNIEKASIDTEDCTSCNECVDQFPGLFEYNDEKQAVLKDPGKGTFEHLVKAAEKCPAECIHPGKPLNPDEPNVEKLKKRAAKFN